MSWRGLCISSPARLDLRAGRLLLRREGEEDVALPLEDLSFVVIDTPQVRLSAALLSACAEQGCLLLTVDARHMPCAAVLPLAPYYRQLSTLQAQVALGEVRKKRLWQACVRAKIGNQAACLRLLGRDGAERVATLRTKVGSGDPDNVEAVAARLYWSRLFRHFRRDPDAADRRNSLLNYAYALLRACVARELAARGFAPALGIHHRGPYNAFNLADDMMEAWRPFADLLVARHLEAGPAGDDAELSPADKAALLGLLHGQVDWEGGRSCCPRPWAVRWRPCVSIMPKKGRCRPFPSLGNKEGACLRKRCDTCVCWSFSICRSKQRMTSGRPTASATFCCGTAMTGCSSRSMPAFAGARKMWRPISGGCKKTCRRTAACACCR